MTKLVPLVAAQGRRVLGQIYNALEAAQIVDAVLRIVHPDESIRRLRLVAEPVINEQGRIVKIRGRPDVGGAGRWVA